MKSGGTIWYNILGNIEAFLLGDVFVCTDAAYQPNVSYGAGATLLPGSLQFNAMALAWHMPVKEPVAGRLERRVGIYRPNPNPSALAGSGDGSTYFKETKDNDLPLVLTSGTFAFGSAGGQASWVPAGFGSTERPAAKLLFPPNNNTPGMTPAIRYYAYIPPLPGYTPVEGDALVDEEGSRYLVINPYRQEAGVVGYQLSIERQISQVT